MLKEIVFVVGIICAFQAFDSVGAIECFDCTSFSAEGSVKKRCPGLEAVNFADKMQVFKFLSRFELKSPCRIQNYIGVILV